MILDKWQEEIINYDGNIVLNTGRQVGKTMTFARKAAEYMKNHSGSRIIVVSLTEDQAQLMIVMTLDYIERNFKSLLKKAKKPTKNAIWLNNKSQILARPVGNTGDAVRGFTGDVLIVDEASRMPEMMWTAAKPTLATTGGQIWMCSTPFGKKGYFYECWLNKHGRFKVWHVKTQEVYYNRKINKDWTEQKKQSAIEFIEQEKKDMSSLQFAQEYMGQFVEDLRQFFPDTLIQKCMRAQRPGTIPRNRTYSLGVDVARMGKDETTFEILWQTDQNNLIQVENQITKRTLLTDTARRIFELDNLYDFRKIYLDDEGIGIGVFDMLISDERTRRKVEALRNSKKIYDYRDQKMKKMLKEDLYMNLLKLMELGKIQLLDDPELFQSFKSVQYEMTNDKTGKPFLHIFGNYTHIVEGLIRAAWIDKEKNLSIGIGYI